MNDMRNLLAMAMMKGGNAGLDSNMMASMYNAGSKGGEETPEQKAARILKEKMASLGMQSKPTESEEELDKFANWHGGDVQKWNDEMSKRGMLGQVKFASTFGDDTNVSEKYLAERKNSGIWKMELQQNILKEAKRAGIKNKEGITANQDYLFKKATSNLRDFQTEGDKNSIREVFKQGVGDQTIGDNFWETTKNLYQDLTKKEVPVNNLTAKK